MTQTIGQPNHTYNIYISINSNDIDNWGMKPQIQYMHTDIHAKKPLILITNSDFTYKLQNTSIYTKTFYG